MATHIFQFWHSKQAPAKVEAWMSCWAEHPDFIHRRYNARRAGAYIARHFDDRTLAAYEKCAVPAMQSDFFRYCALLREGGVYLDVNLTNRDRLTDGGGLANFLAGCDRGALWRRGGNIANGFLFVRSAGDPLLRRIVQRAIENIETEVSNDVWKVTGPGILTRDFWDGERAALFEGFTLIDEARIDDLFLREGGVAKKKGASDWRAHRRDGARPIFVKAPDDGS